LGRKKERFEMQERTLVILKPDAVKRGLVGAIIERFERAGLSIAAARMDRPTTEMFDKHYQVEKLAPIIGQKSKDAGTDVGPDITAYGRMVLGWNRDYMMEGPILILVLEGENAIKRIRALVGTTNPQNASPGSIRGDFGVDSIAKANRERRGTANLVHASDKSDQLNANPFEEANYEISLWFSGQGLENKHAG
jgi:nucleoside-diphosphate kinase